MTLEKTPERNSVGPDRILIVVVAVLMIFGLIMVQSASGPVAAERYHDAWFFVKRQAFAGTVGLLGAAAVAVLPYRWLRQQAWALYGVVVLGLILVFVPGVGRTVKGASRWIGLGSFSVQPSEFAKLAVILTVAWWLQRHQGKLHDLKGVVIPGLLIPLPLMGLVLMEPDFGNTAILAGLTILLMSVAGLRIRWLATLLGVTLMGLGPAMLLADYRVRRWLGFLNPWADPSGDGYQIIQSLVAYASGGFAGRGLGESQSKHQFLPEPWTDFIGSVVGEELGLLGIFFLLSLYGVLVWRGLHIAAQAPDLFGLMVAVAITALLGGQAFFNLGVTLGVVPPKGMVLPLVSYGGSALMCHLIAIGFLLNISAHGSEDPVASLRLSGVGDLAAGAAK
jgi:cell division protein FtsW